MTDTPKDDADLTAQFDELKRRVAALKMLLDAPEPGLLSWCGMYASHMKFISDYWVNN